MSTPQELQQQILSAVAAFNARLADKGIELDQKAGDNSLHIINYLRRNNIPTSEWTNPDTLLQAYSHIVKTGAFVFVKGKEPLRFRSTTEPTVADLAEERARRDKQNQANAASAKLESDGQKSIQELISNFLMNGPNGIPRHGASADFKAEMSKGVAILRKRGKKFSEILPDVRVWIEDKQVENERENLVSTSARRRQ